MIRTKVGRAVTILICLLVTGLFALVCANYQHDIHQARERILAGSKIVETPCGPIEYAVAGDGPPVLVVHGAGGGYDHCERPSLQTLPQSRKQMRIPT